MKLPLDQAAIERMLPHRFPFLLVDTIVEFEPDKRIVGVKNVSLNDPYLASDRVSGLVGLPSTILTETVAQVGAILLMAKPENAGVLPLFAGMKRVRYRGVARPGDVVEVEAVLLRQRRNTAVFRGTARVHGTVLLEGTMSCALAPRSQ
jgi:3-hydroxyacyl-[acyl-carrier-protein] dehydratase